MLSFRWFQAELSGKLEEAERRLREVANQHAEEMADQTRKQEAEIGELQEQRCLHVETICLLEQQLDVSVGKSKESLSQIDALKTIVSGLLVILLSASFFAYLSG